jgi:hypothetical protein
MILPKVIKSVQVPHPVQFLSGPRIWVKQFIHLEDRIVAVDFWYHQNGTLYRVLQRELREEDHQLLAN